MKYLSVCSGIEAASVAWGPLGFDPVAFSEIETFPSAVLAHHYPTVANWGDMTNFEAWPDATVDVLVGGTPCQSFSVAGLREGLADPRGSLMLVYLAIARRYRPRWLVWENVPGVLSSDNGRAFGSLLGGLGELGYGFAHRVLDAQYFGLAQRRKRVFVVGHIGANWRRAAAVLFERESLSGHPPPRRKTREGVAGTLGGSSQSGGFRTTDLDNSGAFVPVALPLQYIEQRGRENRQNGMGVGAPDDPMYTLECRQQHGIAINGAPMPFDGSQITHRDNRSKPNPGDPSPTLAPGAHPPMIAFSSKDYGQDAIEDLSPTLRSGNEIDSHASGGVGPAIAYEVPIPIDLRQSSRGEKMTNNREHGSGGAPGVGVGNQGDPAFTVSERGQAVAYGIRSDAGRDGEARTPSPDAEGRERLRDAGFNVYEEIAPTLDAGTAHTVAHADGAIRIACGCGEVFDGQLDTPCPACGRVRDAQVTYPPDADVEEEEPLAFRWMTGGDETTSLPMERDHCPTLDAAGSMAIAFADVADPVAANQGRTYTREGSNNFRMSNVAIGFEPRHYTRDNKTGGKPGDVAVLKADASKAGDSAPHVATAMNVRRLTPRECERLQGFPDDYTLIPYRGKLAADGPRYKALGNSMAVPVMAWIGRRIMEVDELDHEGQS